MAQRRVVRPQRPVYGRKPSPPRRLGPTINYDALRPLRGIFLLGLALVGLWSLFSVRNIEVHGNSTLTSDQVSALVRTSFDHHPFSGNLITLGLAPLAQELPDSDKRIKTVSVRRVWPGTVRLDVVERQPALGWRSGVQQFVLDGEGTAIALQQDLGLRLPTVTDSTNLPVKVGDRVVPAHFVTFCTGLIDNLPKRFGLQIIDMKVSETTSEIYVTTSRHFYIKFDTTRPVEDELGDLKTVLDTLNKLHKTPAEYIDLRIAGKAYYK